MQSFNYSSQPSSLQVPFFFFFPSLSSLNAAQINVSHLKLYSVWKIITLFLCHAVSKCTSPRFLFLFELLQNTETASQSGSQDNSFLVCRASSKQTYYQAQEFLFSSDIYNPIYQGNHSKLAPKVTLLGRIFNKEKEP